MIRFVKIFLILIFLSFGRLVISQVELVPVGHPVYDFLKKMQVEGIIPGYSSVQLPLSRSKVSFYLNIIHKSEKISAIDKSLLNEFGLEFFLDINKNNSRSVSLLGDKKGFLFDENKYRYLYSYTDTNASIMINTIWRGGIFNNKGDSLLNNSAGTGDFGIKTRGTLFNKVGFSLEVHSGKKLFGTENSSDFLSMTNTDLKSDREFASHGNYYTNYRGYIRYQTENGFLSVTTGKDNITFGTGYLNKMFLSESAPPFSFIKFDIDYKKINYSFFYGSIKGDSVDVELQSKNIAGHRLDIRFADGFKAGFYESVIISNNPFSFSYLNPFSFITSANLNTGAKETTLDNSLMGIDFEINPVKNLAIQGTFLLDDINFASLSDTSYLANDNKFGYQLGMIWTSPFSLNNFVFIAEYSRLDPFVYSHRSNKSSYTNWGISMGHPMPPNSDEIALALKVNVTSRIKCDLSYQFQRSGYGIIFGPNGEILYNFGGNINYGKGDFFIIKNKFLNGFRVNKTFFTVNINTQFIRQLYLNLLYRYMNYNLLYSGNSKTDNSLNLGMVYEF
jgi:hypothetical protein